MTVHFAPDDPLSPRSAGTDGGAAAASRIAALVETGSRVLHVDGIPGTHLLDELRRRSCSVTTVTGAPAALGADAAWDRRHSGSIEWPRVREALADARFDTAILQVALTDDWAAFSERAEAVLPFLDHAGCLVVAVSDASLPDRDAIEPPLLDAGLVVGHVDTLPSGADNAGTLILMAFPLPALEITAFRDRVHALDRRAAASEEQARRFEAEVMQLKVDLSVARGQLVERDHAMSELRRHVEHLERTVSRTDADSVRLRAELDANRASERRAAAALAHAESELRQFHEIGSEPAAIRAEVDALRESLRQAGAQMDVMRRSFSWRLSAPIRSLASLLGRNTTDRALGWRE